eukprot:6469113-Amphidinium_carterae.1
MVQKLHSRRVVRHAAFLKCLDCGRQPGKVKGNKYFSYLKRQNFRQLKKKKVKRVRLGEPAPVAPPDGESIGGSLPSFSNQESQRLGWASSVPACPLLSGQVNWLLAAFKGLRRFFPFFRCYRKEPD